MTQVLKGRRYDFVIEADADEPEPQEDELVQPKWACPQCGERRMDYLIPDHNAVRCATCGTCYEL